MGRHKMTIGTCRLCGEKKNLSFEHVPPRVTFNKNTTYLSVPMDDYFKLKNPLTDKVIGKQKQGGVGFNSLCKNCNSFLGKTYVNAYKKWVWTGLYAIGGKDFTFTKYTAKNQEPLKIIKQIVSMFLSVNNEGFVKSYSELSDFVRDPESQYLPKKYRIFTYLNNVGIMRYMHQSTVWTSMIGVANCSEITYPPYGFVILIDFDKSINLLHEITYFKDYTINESVDLNLELHKLPTNFHIPLDYR